MEIKFADLFAGIGGFHCAIKTIYPNAKPVLVCEIDKFAKETYALNYNYDINKIINIKDYKHDVEDFDLLTAGFPCQPFSNAGKKIGFNDEARGNLFFDIVKILIEKKPQYILLENVKHLVKHDNGKTWKIISEKLKEIGYIIPKEPIILSPHQFGVPQIRPRVFIPGILKEKASITEFKDDAFEFEDNEIRQILFESNISNLNKVRVDKDMELVLEAWGEFILKVKRPENKTLPIIWLDYMNDDEVDYSGMQKWKINYIQNMKLLYKNNKAFIDEWMLKNNTSKWNTRNKKLEWKAGKDETNYKNTYIQLRQSGIRFKKNNVFPTLVAMIQTPMLYDEIIKCWRYLTINEVRQLQSFPPNFILNKNEQQSFKQFGNAVNVDVARGILERLIGINMREVNYKERRSHWDEWEQNILKDKNLMAALKALSNK